MYQYMKKIISVIAGIILVIFSSYIILENSKMNSQEILTTKYEISYTPDFAQYRDKVLWQDKTLFWEFISLEDYLTNVVDGMAYVLISEVQLNPEFTELYERLGPDKNQKTVVVYPFFTAVAYSEPGFYTYYKGECGADSQTCLTISLKEKYPLAGHTSGKAVQVLHLLGYDFISDIDIYAHPKILEKYDKVLLLHSEYVTKEMFNAITSHPKVIFLYPNALYAEIEFDYKSNTIQLIRGHGYPTPDIVNGFDWEFENTHPYEFDTECKNWEFYEITNGFMLNCYPENIFHDNLKFLQKIKEL